MGFVRGVEEGEECRSLGLGTSSLSSGCFPVFASNFIVMSLFPLDKKKLYLDPPCEIPARATR